VTSTTSDAAELIGRSSTRELRALHGAILTELIRRKVVMKVKGSL